MTLQWVAALLASSNLQLRATLWFLRRPTYRCCHNAESCKETDIKKRGAGQTRCRITHLTEEREGVNIGILLLWQQSVRSNG